MKTRRIFLYIFIVIVIFCCYVGWMFFGPTVHSKEGRFFFIHTGAGYENVKDSLVKNDIISSSFWFDKVASYVDYNKNIKPGKYKIVNGMSVVNLVRMLKSGSQTPVNLIITKLRTKEDLAKKLADNFETDSLTIIRFLNNSDSVLQFNCDTNTIISIIIPNTYTFTWNTTLQKILKKLYNEKEKFWNDDRKQKAEALKLTPTQVYTLASIVEEETNRQEDKGNIASVYLNRFRKNMKLAADPTIKFAMRDFGLKRIYFKYLSYPSPYNTYLHEGLPPGPINTPSIKTIDAVLNEPQTDYLFFVARLNSGGLSDFSSNFQQHSAYAKAYRDALDSLVKQKVLVSKPK